jgi:hypothetical protein
MYAWEIVYSPLMPTLQRAGVLWLTFQTRDSGGRCISAKQAAMASVAGFASPAGWDAKIGADSRRLLRFEPCRVPWQMYALRTSSRLCLCWVLRQQCLQECTASLLIYLCKRRAQRRSMSERRVPCLGITASSSSVCRTVLQCCPDTSAPQQQPQGTAVRVRTRVPCTLSGASEMAAVPAAHISQGNTAGRPQRHMRQGCNL